MNQGAVAIDGMKKSADSGVESFNLWANTLKEPLAILPMVQQDTSGLGRVFEQTTQQTQQGITALQAFGKAMQSDTMASAQQLSQGLMGLIAGRRAQAGVEAVWETAQGIKCLAEGTWPPNPAAIIAAGLHFEASAQYAILAGTSAHHRGAASAGAGSSSSDSYGGGSQGVQRVGGSPSGGGPSSGGGNTYLQIPPGMGAHGMQQMMAWIGAGSQVGLFKLSSQGSSGVNAPLY
jgi:uncharacterized membrane protein YgcG